MKAAYDEGAPPYELVLGWLMDRLHKTPEEIEGCDILRLLRITDLTATYDAFKKHQKGERLSEAESKLVGEILILDMEQLKKKGL